MIISRDKGFKISVSDIQPIDNYIEKLIIKACKKTDKEVFEHILEQNIELQQRIDETIEFINSQSPDDGVCGKTIKKILKGSDKDE